MIALLLACHASLDTSPETCAGCHPTEVEAWKGSRHAIAATNAIFTEASHRAQDPWCESCHFEGGVSCVTCHAGDPTQACLGCHQFVLPGTDLPSQDTVAEHAASSFAALSCHECHDPHRPQGAHDHAAVRNALSIDVVATDTASRATLTTTGVGHAFPTGDPFRRLQLQVCADLSCNQPVGHATLERRLSERGGWHEASDTRIPPPVDGEQASVTVDLPAARGWKLVYHLTDPRHPTVPGSSWLVQQGGVRETPGRIDRVVEPGLHGRIGHPSPTSRP